MVQEEWLRDVEAMACTAITMTFGMGVALTFLTLQATCRGLIMNMLVVSGFDRI